MWGARFERIQIVLQNRHGSKDTAAFCRLFRMILPSAISIRSGVRAKASDR